MKIAVIGCVQFSQAMTEALESTPGIELAGIVTRRASMVNADFQSLEPIGTRLGVPVLIADGMAQDAMAAWLAARSPQAIFCVGWSSLLKPPMLKAASQGVIGYHPVLLPANRGRHPIIWALALGLAETGSTFFAMDEGADSGDILSQERVPIGPDDDAASLYRRLTETARGQIVRLAADLAAGRAERRPQDPARANAWRKRGPLDGRIDWRMSADAIHNLVRALARPYVGAHCDWQGRACKVWRTQPAGAAAANLEPGKVLARDGHAVVVKCGDAALRLVEHDLDPLPQPGDYL